MSGAYPPINDYGFLSDTHTAALVAPDGAVEWMCVPRFDGESVFARILDRRRGGAFELTVAGAGAGERAYSPGTLVLETRYSGAQGSVLVEDCLAVARSEAAELGARHVLVRRVRCTQGTARVRAAVEARPGYGARAAEWEVVGGTAWRSEEPGLWLTATVRVEADGPLLVAELELADGDDVAFLLGYGSEAPQDAEDAGGLVEETRRAWEAWSSQCDHGGLAAEHVLRSAVVLRALAFDETGALLAAPTTSLPEEIGGERNWDYRFTWHRDAALLVLSLFRLGYAQEGRRYIDFLLDLCAVRSDRLPPMAGIGGETDSEERRLEHLEGYEGSRPVRVGNEAFEQVQLDTYGHVLDAALAYHELTGDLEPRQWQVLRHLVELVAEHWREPDHGIWEMREEKRQYVNSKMLAWVCLDRACRLARSVGDEQAPVDRWREARDEIRSDVLERGYDPERGAFVQVYGERPLDASVLRAFLLRFLDGDDPRVSSTIDALIAELGAGDALIHRYASDEVDDGVEGGEGAFLMCSFELVSALVLCGRTEEARRRFDALLELAGPLGLFSEESDADGRALGNFPQAFTHLALIQAALNLEAAEDEEALHAWAERRATA